MYLNMSVQARSFAQNTDLKKKIDQSISNQPCSSGLWRIFKAILQIIANNCSLREQCCNGAHGKVSSRVHGISPKTPQLCAVKLVESFQEGSFLWPLAF